MTKEEAINRGIELIKGQPMFEGMTCAHKSDNIVHEFVRYEGAEAVCKTLAGEEKRFPRDEIFDPNKLMNVAMHLYNLGHWHEGMECTILRMK